MKAAKEHAAAGDGFTSSSAFDHQPRDKVGVKFVQLTNHRYERLIDRAKRFSSPNLQNEKKSRGLEKAPGTRPASSLELPTFGNLELYKVLPSTQEKLWGLETERLAKIVDIDKATELLPKVEKDSKASLLSRIDKPALEDLCLRADDILDALHICIFDDQRLLQTASASDKAARSYRALERSWSARTGVVRLPGRDRKSERERDDATLDRRDNERPELVKLNAAEFIKTQRLSCYLVDQIAATLAILACRGRHSNYWHAVVLSCLAKLSTKLKVLLGNLSDNIDICFNRASEYHYRPSRSWQGSDEDEWEEKPLDANSTTETRYCTEFDKVSSWLTECFNHALRGIGAQKPWWNESSHIDLCAMVYAAGLSGTRTLICQDRRGEISGSSASLPVSFSSKSLGLVGELSILLGQRSKPLTSSNLILEIDLHQSDGKSINPEVKSLHIHTVAELVVIATALSLSHPIIGQRFQDSLHAISALPVFGTQNDIDDNPSNSLKSAPKDPFYAFVSLGSRQAGDSMQTSSSLSRSHIAAIRHDVLTRQPPRPDQLRHPPSPSEIERILVEADKYRKNLETEIKRWNIAETSITISCPKYVYSVMLLSAILVAGGLLCGFLVGERVPGVDPFNLTMFSWIIGGFVILIAKSVRVSDWPWRDFLSRQVTCRTVREVATVSGLDPQDVLIFLLSSEAQSRLKVRGPFWGMFHSPTPDPGAFSVDVRPSLQTLLASGIIPITVGTLEGPAVYFLRLVPGFRRCVVLGLSGKVSSDVVVCKDPPQHDESCDATLVTERLSWIKILGLYNATGVLF